MTRRRWLSGSSSLAISLLAACNRGKLADNKSKSSLTPLTLTSPSFPDGFIPSQFTCTGDNHSPELSWSAPPAGTQSWVLLLESEANPSKLYWLIYDLPASLHQLPAALPNQPFLSQGGLQAKNDFGQYGYQGPCPTGRASSYWLKLYALSSLLDLPPGVSPTEVRAALQPQILAEASLSLRVTPT